MTSGQGSSDDRWKKNVGEWWRESVLLNGHRGYVTGITAGLVFAFLSLLSLSGFTPLRSTQPLSYVYGGLISGNLTVITVVVSISQLLLSRELETPQELRSQIEGAVDYRETIEDATGQIAPVEPQGFLQLLYENTRTEAQNLGGLAFTEADEEVYDEIEPIVSKLTDRADRVDGLLKESDASTFNELSTTLTTNYARDIHHLRQIQSRHDGRLPRDVDDAIESLTDSLQDIDITRQYFKAIYLQEELSYLSRLLFYVGLPAVAIVVVGLFLLTGSGGTTIARPVLAVVAPAIITIGLLPLTVLFAFILRITTVTQLTAATLPFTTPNQKD